MVTVRHRLIVPIGTNRAVLPRRLREQLLGKTRPSLLLCVQHLLRNQHPLQEPATSLPHARLHGQMTHRCPEPVPMILELQQHHQHHHRQQYHLRTDLLRIMASKHITSVKARHRVVCLILYSLLISPTSKAIILLIIMFITIMPAATANPQESARQRRRWPQRNPSRSKRRLACPI